MRERLREREMYIHHVDFPTGFTCQVLAASPVEETPPANWTSNPHDIGVSEGGE